jgi:hypothetical protein
MKCPHCDQLLSYVICSECGGETPEKGVYCCQCGKVMKRQEGETELSERILCRDGSCVGTVNEKGVCNVCGKPDSEDLK